MLKDKVEEFEVFLDRHFGPVFHQFGLPPRAYADWKFEIVKLFRANPNMSIDTINANAETFILNYKNRN